METRLTDDGNQLRPELVRESSGEAMDASAARAPCMSIEVKHSEHISLIYMVEYQGAYVRARWRL